MDISHLQGTLRKYIKSLALSSAILCLSPMGAAQAETMRDAVESSLANHPRYEIALLQIESAEQKRIEERSAFFPTLRGGASGGRIYGDNSTSRGLSVTRDSGYSWLWEGNVAVTQTLFDGLGTVNRSDAAQARINAANYSKDDVEELLTLETALAYLDVLRTQEALKLLDKHKASMVNYRPQFKILVVQGAVDSTDQNQAEDVISALDGTELEFTSQLASAKARYNMMTGHDPEGDLAYSPATLDMPSDLDLALAWALENHPQIRAAKGESDAAWHDAEAEKSMFFPKIDSELSYMKEDQDDAIGGEATDARALVKMNWAFSTGGAELSKFKRGRKLYQESLAQRRNLENTLTHAIKESWITRDKLSAQSELSKRRQQLSQALLSTRREQFEGGKISLLELMQAHNQYYTLALEKTLLGYAQYNSEFLLLGSMGALHSRLTPQVEMISAVKDEDAIEGYCDHQSAKAVPGKGAADQAASISELCPSSGDDL
jgi:adhesin transport system outer membrane protein